MVLGTRLKQNFVQARPEYGPRTHEHQASVEYGVHAKLETLNTRKRTSHNNNGIEEEHYSQPRNNASVADLNKPQFSRNGNPAKPNGLSGPQLWEVKNYENGQVWEVKHVAKPMTSTTGTNTAENGATIHMPDVVQENGVRSSVSSSEHEPLLQECRKQVQQILVCDRDGNNMAQQQQPQQINGGIFVPNGFLPSGETVLYAHGGVMANGNVVQRRHPPVPVFPPPPPDTPSRQASIQDLRRRSRDASGVMDDSQIDSLSGSMNRNSFIRLSMPDLTQDPPSSPSSASRKSSLCNNKEPGRSKSGSEKNLTVRFDPRQDPLANRFDPDAPKGQGRARSLPRMSGHTSDSVLQRYGPGGYPPGVPPGYHHHRHERRHRHRNRIPEDDGEKMNPISRPKDARLPPQVQQPYHPNFPRSRSLSARPADPRNTNPYFSDTAEYGAAQGEDYYDDEDNTCSTCSSSSDSEFDYYLDPAFRAARIAYVGEDGYAVPHTSQSPPNSPSKHSKRRRGKHADKNCVIS